MSSNEHSDAVFICGEYNHRLHRAIISAQSDVLAPMCRGSFKEGLTGEIYLPDDDPEITNIMVKHLYGERYKDARSNSGASGEDLALLDMQVYEIADNYNIPSLSKCVKGEFKDWSTRSQDAEPDTWMRIVELIWKDNRYPGLHAVIENQVAGRIDRMLHGEWLSFIDRGMKLGRLSASFLQ